VSKGELVGLAARAPWQHRGPAVESKVVRGRSESTMTTSSRTVARLGKGLSELLVITAGVLLALAADEWRAWIPRRVAVWGCCYLDELDQHMRRELDEGLLSLPESPTAEYRIIGESNFRWGVLCVNRFLYSCS